jgi:hypothetical protein
MNAKQEFEELLDMRSKIQSPVFQKYIVKPIYEEMDKLKSAYDCDSLRELHTIKGKKQGLKFFIEILKQIDKEYANKLYEIENSDE